MTGELTAEKQNKQNYYIEQLRQLCESMRHDDGLANLIASYYYTVFIGIVGGALTLYFKYTEKFTPLLVKILGLVFIIFYIAGMGLLLILIKNNKSKWRIVKQIKVVEKTCLSQDDYRKFNKFDLKAERKVVKVANLYGLVIFIIQTIVLAVGLILIFGKSRLHEIMYISLISLFSNLVLTISFLICFKLWEFRILKRVINRFFRHIFCLLPVAF